MNLLNPIPGITPPQAGSTVDPTQVIAELSTVSVSVRKDEVQDAPPSERAMVRRFLDQSRVPHWMTRSYDRIREDREYVNEILFAEDQPNTFSVNLVARALQQKVSTILPTDADCSVRHERGVGSVDLVRRDAIRKANAAIMAARLRPNPIMLLQKADEAEQRYREDLEARERYSQTNDALIKKLWDEASGTPILQDSALGGMTTGLVWIKTGWQRDYGRDSLGRRNDDAQDQLALLALLSAEYAAGRFGQSDERYGDLIRLSDYARIVAQAVVQGQVEPGTMPFAAWQGIKDTRDKEPVPSQWLPEPEVWQGGTIDLVQPEHMRWDWRMPISRWHLGSWVDELNLMDLDEVAAMYHLAPDEKDRLGTKPSDQLQRTARSEISPSADSAAADPDRSNYDSQVQRGKVVVHERWDRRLNRRFVMVEGLQRFLADDVVRLSVPGFYPYDPVMFNPADGAHMPISDVRYMRKVQDAINQRLTDSQESIWASMKRYLVKKNAFREGELAKLRAAKPHDVIEMEAPEEIMASFKEIASDDWNPAKYNLDQLFRLFELVSGVSLSQLGVVGTANFAAEAEISNNASQQTAGRHGVALASAQNGAMTKLMYYAASSMSEKTVKWLVGEAAYWPEAPSRLDLLRAVRLKIDSAGSTAAAKVRAGRETRDVVAALGSILDLRAKGQATGVKVDIGILATQALRAIDVDAPVREVLQIDQVAESQLQAGPALPPAPGGLGPDGPPAPGMPRQSQPLAPPEAAHSLPSPDVPA